MTVTENIEKLEFPYSIRKRPGVFGADLITPNLLLREVLDNTVDLVLKTRKPIEVTALTNRSNWNIVCDNGSGIPVYLDKDYDVSLDKPIIIDLLSKLNVGSNFTKTQYSLGMHGLGLKGTNALSDYFNVYVNVEKQKESNLPEFVKKGLKEGKSIFVIRFEKGLLQNFEMIAKNEILISEINTGKLTDNRDITKFLESLSDDFGTIVAFKPDEEMHESMTVSYHGYPVKLIKSLFKFDKDLSKIDFKLNLNGKEIEPLDFQKMFSDKLINDKVFSQSVDIKTDEPLPIKFIYQVSWSADKFNFDCDGSVNLLQTPSGKHINLVTNAISQAFSKYNSLIKPNDTRLGMRLFALGLMLEPLFNSQDKTKLSKIEDKGYNEKEVIKTLADSFLKLMKENSEYFDLLCERIIEYKRATEKLSNIELLKSKIVMGDESDKKRIMSGQMSRVYECTSDDYSKRELYIVEGLSASGNLLQTRNKLFQAILPLQGKMRNTSTLDEEKLVDNKEVLAIVNTIGCGLGGICDPSKSRYNKVIIASDFDSDGCLLGDTVIDVQKEGRTFVIEIEELVDWKRKGKLEGTYAKSFNIESGLIEYKPIINAVLTKYVTKDELLTYRFSNGLGTQHVTATKNHLFYTKSGRYVRLDELNEEVITDSDPGYFDLGVNPCLEKIDNDMLIPVYDIEVQDNHNFYANDVLVHNSHIANLITTLFLHHAPEMIKQGYLYKVEAPYYKVIDGKKVKYYYHDEKDKIDFSKEVHKLKGLGSYTKEEAKQFLMDTKERRLIPIVWNPDMEYEIQEASKLMYSGLARKKLMIERGIFNQEDIL
jgi:DNA gyrase, B subunit|nr:MAG TPA: DNA TOPOISOMERASE IV, B SUBUNIT [Caudoviricetes sp.]